MYSRMSHVLAEFRIVSASSVDISLFCCHMVASPVGTYFVGIGSRQVVILFRQFVIVEVILEFRSSLFVT
jgi:hypothetical protein